LATEIGKGGQRMQITGSRGLSWSQPGGSRGSTDRQRAAAAVAAAAAAVAAAAAAAAATT